MTMSFIAYEQYDKSKNLTTQGFWVGDGTVLVNQTEGCYDDYIKEQKLKLDEPYERPSWWDKPHQSLSLMPEEVVGILCNAYELDDGMVFEQVTWDNRPGWFDRAVQVLAFKHGDLLEVRERASIKWSQCQYDTKIVDGQLDMRAIPGTIRPWHKDDLFSQVPNVVTLRLGEWHMLAMAVLKMGGRSLERIQSLTFPMVRDVAVTHHGFTLDTEPVDFNFFKKIDLDMPLDADLLPMKCIS
jgi:hypothetical protein